MEKFTNHISESKVDEQLELGIKIESEHLDLYKFYDNFLYENDMENPLTEREFFERIAKAHIKEIPDYYYRLVKMEDN